MCGRVDTIGLGGARTLETMLVAAAITLFAAGAVRAEVDEAGCPVVPPWGEAERPSQFPCVREQAELDPSAEPAAAGIAPKAATDRAYNKDFWNARFGHHTLDNFPGFTTVANSVFGDIYATDFDPTATTLYALNTGTLELGTINLTTGAFTAIGPSVPSGAGHNNWSGLAIHPVTGVLYASAIAGTANVPYGLYTIDKTTGTPTPIGQDPVSMGMIAIAINCSGQMYGHDIVTDSIYSIDTATGAVTLRGSTGVASNFAQGMDFDNETGTLYAWTYQSGGANQFGAINLATGLLSTLSASNPIGEFEGAIKNQCGFFFDGFESSDTSAWSSSSP